MDIVIAQEEVSKVHMQVHTKLRCDALIMRLWQEQPALLEMAETHLKSLQCM